MKKKLINRFLTLGMLLCVLTFGTNIVLANPALYNMCVSGCFSSYQNCEKFFGFIHLGSMFCENRLSSCLNDCESIPH